MTSKQRLPQPDHPPLGWSEQAVFVILGFLLTIDYYLESSNFIVAVIKTLWTTAMLAGILYLNYYVLIPMFLKRQQYLRYGIACVASAAGYIVLQRWSGLEMYLCEEETWHGPFSTAADWALYLLLSTLFWYYREYQTDRERQAQFRSEQLEAELRFLRAQVSPHFIFNSLNNIYALALQGHPNAAPMVARLADILRYALYENIGQTVPLAHELHTVGQYIELQQLRNLPAKNIDFYIEGHPKEHQIVPMLLLGFVENSFKHSYPDQDEKAWIRIAADMSEDGVFQFSTANSRPPQFKATDVASGIGLKNARRQLELYYPGQHHLVAEETDEAFELHLRIVFNKPT